MKYTGAKCVLAALVLASAIWPLASAAHSMREVEAALEAAEPAAEVVDEAAPDLVLEDARGKQVRLDDLSGRVVILDVTSAAPTNGCTVSAGPMAKVRELVTQVPGLHEQLRFLTVTGPGAAVSGDRQNCGQGDPGTNSVFVMHATRRRDGTRTDLAAALGLGAATATGAVVLDARGRIRLRLRGSRFDPLQLMLFAAAQAHAEHGATGQSTRAARWATWCVPCREEMPTLDRLQATLGGPDFHVVALSIDQQGIFAVQDFYKELGIKALEVYVDDSMRAASLLGAPRNPRNAAHRPRRARDRPQAGPGAVGQRRNHRADPPSHRRDVATTATIRVTRMNRRHFIAATAAAGSTLIAPVARARAAPGPDVSIRLSAVSAEVPLRAGAPTRVLRYFAQVLSGRADAVRPSGSYLGPTERIEILEDFGARPAGSEIALQSESFDSGARMQMMGGGTMDRMMGGMNMHMPHPMHLHGVRFRIVERQRGSGAAADVADGLIDQGYKDSVLVFPGERVKLLLAATEPGLFMYHCHNLEHEDAGMMRNFLVEA